MTEARVFVHVIIWNLIKSTNFTCTLFGKVICVGLHIGIWRYLTSKHRVNCDNEIENEKVLKILVELNKSELCDQAEGQ